MAKFTTTHETTGETRTWEYASVKNLIKFGLRRPDVPAGQFKITDESGAHVLSAYKAQKVTL